MISVRASLLHRILCWGPLRQRLGNWPLERSRAVATYSRIPLPGGTTVQRLSDDLIRAEQITAANARPDWMLLYLHGGGYVQESPGLHRSLVARLSAVSGMSALMLSYRLAPEYPFPAALDDAIAGYFWLLRQGFAPQHIAFAGDSAGGGLLIAAMIRLRDQGKHLPAAGVCLSPWTDVTMRDALPLEHVDPMIRRDTVRQAGELYAAGHDPCDPLISPVYGDLHGLPPLLIQVGEQEVLRSDSERLAQRAKSAGVPVALEIVPGMWHVWQGFPPFLVPESGSAVQRIGAFLRATLSPA